MCGRNVCLWHLADAVSGLITNSGELVSFGLEERGKNFVQ
jgi:hypothetical protein